MYTYEHETVSFEFDGWRLGSGNVYMPLKIIGL